MRKSILLALMMACGAAQAESVPLIREHGTFVVPVIVNDKITLNFTIDSGASDVSIPADVFSTLTRTGTVSPNDLLDKQTYELADGSKQSSRRFRIRSLRMGSLELRDVVASVAPASGLLLLGQSFLSRIKSWSIDNERHLLVFGATPTRDAVGPVPSRSASTPEQTATTHDSQWIVVSHSKRGTGEVLVDVSSIRVLADVRYAWEKMVPKPHTMMMPTDNNTNKPVEHELVKEGFNCSEGAVRQDAITIYYEDGTNWSLPPESLIKGWVPVPPDTLLSDQMEFVCAWKAT